MLAQIANNIILNIDFHKQRGVSAGRMGSILYLYLYAELKDSEILFSLCNEQLLIILDALNENDMSYAHGIAGIADVLHYLHNEDIIEIPDRDDFFANVNIEILRGYGQPSLEPDSLHTTLYLLNEFDISDVENVNQIEKLLYLERAVEHVDIIETFLGSLKVLKDNSLTESIDRSADIIRVKNISKNLLNIADFLHALKKKKIYLIVVDRCLSLLEKKNNDLLILLYNDSEFGQNFLALSTKLHFLTISFYIKMYFNGGPYNEDKIQFETFLNDFLCTKALSSSLDLRQNSIDLHIATLISLFQVNDKLNSQLIWTGINNYLDAILESFDEKNFCSDFTNSSSIRATLGLLGPAGLGILLMISLDHKFISATHILKKNYTI
ncbi:hypothetical protein ACTJKN_07530 [Pedobacter sp. 22163]|uniref:hypothetical protein n=1 Tax=Pedobacter sp. 22163 TaxID=3453883 RepID=UPI003F83388A